MDKEDKGDISAIFPVAEQPESQPTDQEGHI